MTGSEARTKVQKLIAVCDDLRRQIESAEQRAAAIATTYPDDDKRYAWGEHSDRLKQELRTVDVELAETRALAVRLLCTDRYQAAYDKARAAHDEAAAKVRGALLRQKTLLLDPAHTLAQEVEIKAEIAELSAVADRTAHALTRAAELRDRWITYAHTGAGLRSLGLLAPARKVTKSRRRPLFEHGLLRK